MINLFTNLKRKEVNSFCSVEFSITPIIETRSRNRVAMRQSKPIVKFNKLRRVDPFKRITPDDEEKNNA